METQVERAVRPFDFRVKQEAAQVIKSLIKNGIAVEDYLAYVEEVRKQYIPSRYEIVNGKKQRRKRSLQERQMRKKLLAEAQYGRIKAKP